MSPGGATWRWPANGLTPAIPPPSSRRCAPAPLRQRRSPEAGIRAGGRACKSAAAWSVFSRNPPNRRRGGGRKDAERKSPGIGHHPQEALPPERTEGGRVGEEWVRTGRYGWM